MKTILSGMRTSPNVRQEVLILTDGLSNCGGNATVAALALQNVADVYGLMIGRQQERGAAELESFVSDPTRDHIFAIENLRDLRSLVDDIEEYLDQNPCAPFERK